MTEEIKRLNYFTSQFLEEKDFKDEQAYHRRMRHLHNRSLHTWGVVEGLNVTEGSGDKQVSVSPGMAIDKEGQEIVVLEEQTFSLSETGSTVYITIAAQDAEDRNDPYQLVSGTKKYTRTTERPQLEDKNTQPADDGTVILLAEVQLDNSGNVEINNSVRKLAGHAAKIEDDGAGTSELADGAVTNPKIKDGAVNAAKIEDGSVGTNELADGAVTNPKIKDGAVNAAKIEDGSVGTNELDDGAVTNPKIKDEAVTKDKIAQNAVSLLQLHTTKVANDLEILVGGKETKTVLLATEGRDTHSFYLISVYVNFDDLAGEHGVNWYQRSEVIHETSGLSSSFQSRHLVFENRGEKLVRCSYSVYRLSEN